MRRIMQLLLFVFVIVVLFVGFKSGHKTKNVQVMEVNQADSVTGASFYGPVLQWNSFLGGNKNDNGYSIAIDTNSDVYVCGWSDSNWGSPVNPFGGGGSDAFVAKLNSNGFLQWHTFLGGNRDDLGHFIALDGKGNIYVTGNSESSWGSPLNPFGGGSDDAFVAKLNSNGVRQWHTFLGGDGWESIDGILIDGSRNIYVVGYGESTWGTPINPFGGGDSDAFVAKLNSNGIRQWNTFLGGNDVDFGSGIVLDGSENIYVTGGSKSAWGSPVNPFGGGDYDAFAAKLNANGVRQWHTFLGGSGSDSGMNIVMDGKGNIYVTGNSMDSWGSPVNPFGGGYNDTFVAKLKSNGVRQWHTFLGGNDIDFGSGIVLDGSDNIFVTGYSHSAWGSPVNPFGGETDGFLAKLYPNGVRQWHTFLGGSAVNSNSGIVLDESGNIYVAGHSMDTWGTPVNPFGGGRDVFLAKLYPDGVRQWHTFLGGSEWELNNAIVLGESGSIYLTGRSKSTWGCPINPFSGQEDAFVARIIDADAIPPYEITSNRDNLFFGCTGNVSPGSQTFIVSSDNSNPLVPIWSVTDDQPWISCNPINGTGPALVTVSVNSTGLSAGAYTGIITVSDPKAENSPQTIGVTLSVYSHGQTTPPFGHYTTPGEGSLVYGSVPFTGWALDDIGIESVKIYLQEGSTFHYIGDAVFIEGARPDIEQAYPGFPLNYRAGWGYMMLTNCLPGNGNGIFSIAAVAMDLEGNRVTLGNKTITVDNANAVKPFGTIDTPGQGDTASGSSYRNWGWILTPQPNMIPTNGTTIEVWVDGVNLGHPTYDLYRSDVAALFPGYANSNGAGGYFDIDTTTYNNGVHSVFWMAADNGGNMEVIGSRYFSILNTWNSQVSTVNTQRISAIGLKDLIDIPLSNDTAIKFNKGYNDSYLPEPVLPDDAGIVNIQCRELETIELQVFQRCMRVEGYMIVAKQLRNLPIGTTLENSSGKFRWTPGPGFVGNYRFVFVGTNRQGEQSRKDFMITILSKFSPE